MTREHRPIGQRRTEVHPNIDPDGMIQAETLGLVVTDQLDKDAGRSLHDTEDFDLGSIVASMVLAPPEPTDALELHVPVLAIEGGFLVQGLKRLYPALIRLESWKPATLPEEALERAVDPDQRRILTPPVELAKPLIVPTKRRQGSTLVVQADAPTRLLVTVDPFLQRAVEEKALLRQKLGKVPMGVGVEFRFIGVRSHRGSLSREAPSRMTNRRGED